MADFVRASAVLVGTANVLMLAAMCLRLAATGAEELEGLNGYHVLLGLFVAVVSGLLAAQVVLWFALRGNFPSRYAATVLGTILGGALAILFSALLVAGPVSIAESGGTILLRVAVLTL